MRHRILLGFALIILCEGCMRDPYWVFASPESTVLLRPSSSEAVPVGWYFTSFEADSIEARVMVWRNRDLKMKPAPGSLLVDLLISPERRAKNVEFHPERIRIWVKGASLRMQDSGIRCGYPNICYLRASFVLPGLADVGVSPDSTWCTLDLEGVLSYQGRPLGFASMEGQLPAK